MCAEGSETKSTSENGGETGFDSSVINEPISRSCALSMLPFCDVVSEDFFFDLNGNDSFFPPASSLLPFFGVVAGDEGGDVEDRDILGSSIKELFLRGELSSTDNGAADWTVAVAAVDLTGDGKPEGALDLPSLVDCRFAWSI